ncbi:MAG: DUF2809 domain-containing protein [Planctomycetota bacterium]
MRSWRLRVVYLLLAGVVIALGLASRRYKAALPEFLAAYAGDTLWALMVLLGFSALLPRLSTKWRAAIAMAFSVAIETSQLYHAPFIDAIRHTTLGGLVLGYGFLWSDLICYTVGIAAGAAVDYRFRESGGVADTS